MNENIKFPKTIDNQNNQAEQIKALVEYGRINGGWYNLLSLEKFEKDIFLVDSAWQEAEAKGADGSIPGLNRIGREMKAINSRIDNLNKLTKDIQHSFQQIQEMGISEKKDAGVIMKTLISVNISELNDSQTEIVGELLINMEKFRELYEEWKKYHKENIEIMIDTLGRINSGKLKSVENSLYTSFPTSAGDINKNIRGDSGWSGIRRKQ